MIQVLTTQVMCHRKSLGIIIYWNNDLILSYLVGIFPSVVYIHVKHPLPLTVPQIQPVPWVDSRLAGGSPQSHWTYCLETWGGGLLQTEPENRRKSISSTHIGVNKDTPSSFIRGIWGDILHTSFNPIMCWQDIMSSCMNTSYCGWLPFSFFKSINPMHAVPCTTFTANFS